jgi:Protein of unknown function (DUF1566).
MRSADYCRAVTVFLVIFLGAFMISTSNANAFDPPAWSNILKPNQRFDLVLSNEAVLDKETGLVWESNPDPTPRTWYNAVYTCTKKVVGGRMGWRLPTVEELSSLIDPTHHNPSLPPGHPFVGVGNVYLTMTTNAEAEQGFANYPYAVGFYDAYGPGPSLPPGKTILIPAWCVRGGHGYNGR